MSLKRAGWLLIAVAPVLLASLLFVYDSIVRIRERPYSTAKTLAIIDALDKACRIYRLEYEEYPPGRADFDSRVLHRCLGSRRWTRKVDGNEVDAPPILEFPPDWFQLKKGEIPDPGRPAPIVDAWGRPVRYANPGRHNKKGVNIWSLGHDGKEELDPKSDSESDDLTNWVKDY